jgi:hypothetical protein
MAMSLANRRSIIETHRGRVWASTCLGGRTTPGDEIGLMVSL